MLLINEIGPITRKLVSYAGVAPGIIQSAEHTVHGGITRDCNKYIRWILIEAAQNASRFDTRLWLFCLRVSNRRGH
jgi:transposase